MKRRMKNTTFLPTSLLCAGIVALACATQVRADCQPDSYTHENPPEYIDDYLPLAGGTVVCSGSDEDGFKRNGNAFPTKRDSLTVNVIEGAWVGGTYTEGGIRLYNSNNSTITNNGTVTPEMFIGGDQGSVINNETGVAEAAFVTGADAILTNHGTINQLAQASGTNAVVTNNGTVLGNLQVDGLDGTLANTQGARAGFVSAEGDRSRVTNDGIITDGMIVRGSDVTVANNGDIESSPAAADAIQVIGSGTVQNSGTITAKDELQQDGIIGGSKNGSLTINNTGSVDVTGIGIGISAEAGATGTITNSGSVATAGLLGPGLGLLGSGSITNTLSGTIVTNGRDSEGIGTDGNYVDILNRNSIRTMGIDSAGIDKTGDYGKLTNDGTIRTDLGNSPGILVVGDNYTFNPNILNNNTIETDGYTSPGIAVNGLGNYVQTAEGSSITTTGIDADGIITNNVRVVENGGSISTGGLLSDGIESAGEHILIDNLDTGTINVSGDGGTGITINGSDAVVSNKGSIETKAGALWGVFVQGNRANVENDGGSIKTVSSGIYIIGEDAWVSNLKSPESSFIETIEAQAHGVVIEGNNAIVDNYSYISTGGDGARGVFITGEDATLVNHSDSEINSAGAAIYLVGGSSWVENNGTLKSGLAPGASDADGIHIEATGPDTMTVKNSRDIDAFGTDSDGISVSASGTAIIDNSGVIVTTDYAADGIQLSGVAEYNVSSSGYIVTVGDAAHGIALQQTAGSGDMSIANDGEIRASGLGSAAIRLATVTGNKSTVYNSATGVLAAAGEAIYAGEGDETVRNYGTITGDVSLEAGDDIFVRGANSSLDGIVDGGSEAQGDWLEIEVSGSERLSGSQFVNFENLSFTGSGDLTLEDTLLVDTAQIEAGTTITLDGEGLLDLTKLNVETGGTLAGNGTVSGAVETNGGNIVTGSSIGALRIEGDLTVNGGVLGFEANSLLDIDELYIGGDFTFVDGIVEVTLGFTPRSEDILEFLIIAGITDLPDEFDSIVGIAGAGSGVALGTLFNVDLGGQLFQGEVTSVVPLPAALYLFGAALLGLAGIARRNQKRASGVSVSV